MSFKCISENFINKVLFPYYSNVSPNYNMVESLFNFVLNNTFDAELLFTIEKTRIEMVTSMHQKIASRQVIAYES